MTKKLSPIGRVSYPHVFEPQEDESSGKLSYSLTLLFDKEKTDLSKMQAEMDACAKEKWQNKPPKGLKLAIRDGDETDKPEYQGHWYITFRTSEKRPPEVIGPDKKPITDRDFYAGCYARVSYNVFAWTHKTGGNGVSFALNNVQKTGEGEALDGRSSADEDFDALEAPEDALFQ